jgi:hypothetical protein
MATLNASLVPWLIANTKLIFASWDHVDAPTEMIAHIVTKEQLSGYTECSFPAIFDGHRVQKTPFTKFVLRQTGNSVLIPKFSYFNIINNSYIHWFMAGKAGIVHHNDRLHSLKKLLCMIHNRSTIAKSLSLMQQTASEFRK